MARWPFTLYVVSYTEHGCGKDEAMWGATEGCRCIPKWLPMSREDESEHAHELDAMDAFRRSDGIIQFCKQKMVAEHWSALVIVNWLQRHHAGATSQIKYVSRADVSNAVKAWRLANGHVWLKSAEASGPGISESALQTRRQTMDALLPLDRGHLLDVLAEVFLKVTDACYVVSRTLRQSQQGHNETSSAHSSAAEHQPPGSVETADIAQGSNLTIPVPGLPHTKMNAASEPQQPLSRDRQRPSNVPPGTYATQSQSLYSQTLRHNGVLRKRGSSDRMAYGIRTLSPQLHHNLSSIAQETLVLLRPNMHPLQLLLRETLRLRIGMSDLTSVAVCLNTLTRR